MATIGICEDDPGVRRVLIEMVHTADHQVVVARTGREAMSAFSAPGAVDLMVIDIGLPDADGRAVCQALRVAGPPPPVLFLTARAAVHDRISGFNAGGDDYVGKPFSVGEVLVRINALLRRTRPSPVPVEGLVLDPERFSVRTPDGEEKLTPTEFRLLAALASRPGEVVRRRAVVAAAWPDGAAVSENTIDSYVRRIRTKLVAAGSPVELVTVRGVGYTLH